MSGLPASDIPVAQLDTTFAGGFSAYPISGDETTKRDWSGYLYNKPVEKAQRLLDHDRDFRKTLREASWTS